MLTPRYTSTAGTPPTAAHNSGATWASEVFSATDSSAARVRPARVEPAGSRPHSDGSSARAPATSPASSRSAIWSPVRPATFRRARRTSPRRWPRPSTPAHAAPAARSTATPSTPSAPSSAPACSAPAAGVGVGQPLQSRCAAAEQRYRVPAPRVAEQQVGEVAGRDPRAAAPTCWRKHSGSVSQVVYSTS